MSIATATQSIQFNKQLPSTDSACCDCSSPKQTSRLHSVNSDSTLVASPVVSATMPTVTKVTELPPNELAARAAIEYALTTSPQLNDYSVSHVLGFGSNGVVMAAKENNIKAKVAIKIIYKSEWERSQPLGVPANLPHEIAVLRAISQQAPHKNVLHHYADWEDELHYYLITELSTTDWLKSEALVGIQTSTEFTFWNSRNSTTQTIRLTAGSADLWAWGVAQSYTAEAALSTYVPSRSAAKTLFRDVALALHHLHSVRIFHGDLKEENILVTQLPGATKRHHVKALLADFGHSRWIPDSATTVNIMSRYGTAEMTPPELLSNLTSGKKSSHVDPFKADVFVLGMLLFVMVHGPGHLPAFVNQTVRNPTIGFEQLLTLTGTGSYPIEEDLNWDSWVGQDRHLISLLRGMMMVDPLKRMSMDDVVQHPWVASHV